MLQLNFHQIGYKIKIIAVINDVINVFYSPSFIEIEWHQSQICWCFTKNPQKFFYFHRHNQTEWAMSTYHKQKSKSFSELRRDFNKNILFPFYNKNMLYYYMYSCLLTYTICVTVTFTRLTFWNWPLLMYLYVVCKTFNRSRRTEKSEMIIATQAFALYYLVIFNIV